MTPRWWPCAPIPSPRAAILPNAGPRQHDRGERDVAGALDVSQANISRIEHDAYLSILRAYIEAGGEAIRVGKFGVSVRR